MFLSFLRREPVLCAAAAAALLSMIAVPPAPRIWAMWTCGYFVCCSA